MSQDNPPTFSIMLVEDDEMIRQLLSLQLGKVYSLEAFPDAESALKRAHERTFDIVLMDISMPGMGGVQGVGILRTIPGYADTPVLAMTGYTLPEDAERFREAGFDTLVEKPFTPRQLREKLEAYHPR